MADSNTLPLLLGIEGGGTRSIALLARGTEQEIGRLELGPANQKLLTPAELIRHFRVIAKSFPRVDGLGICLAGGWEERDWAHVRAAAAVVWPGTPCYAGNDLHSAVMAADTAEGPRTAASRVLLLSGTGSSCYGIGAGGCTAKVGGWGHVLGDEGSGYDIGLSALRLIAATADLPRSSTRNSRPWGLLNWPPLGARVLQCLHLDNPNELIDWAQGADKTAIAALAPEIFAAAAEGDSLARRVLSTAAGRLANDAALCARKIAPLGTPVEFILAGSLLLKQPGFARAVSRMLRRLRPGAQVLPLSRESVWGAVKLAAAVSQTGANVQTALSRGHARVVTQAGPAHRVPALPVSTQISPTERRNPASARLDHMSLDEAILLMLHEESRVPQKLLAHRAAIRRIVQIMTSALDQSGRVFYVGAGTSGRLGVLDASECPPTFGSPPEQVHGIIAGGQRAIWSSVEGAEDDYSGGAAALSLRGVNAKDAVIGLAASGTTPFVWGALKAARGRGAATALVCFNPFLKIPSGLRPDVILACDVGPEVLTGSTRLKAGTATKLLLNIFSTLAMVRIGKVKSNLMIDLDPANTKLRGRATRIVQELGGVPEARALQALASSKWNVRRALARLRVARKKTDGRSSRSRSTQQSGLRQSSVSAKSQR